MPMRSQRSSSGTHADQPQPLLDDRAGQPRPGDRPDPPYDLPFADEAVAIAERHLQVRRRGMPGRARDADAFRTSSASRTPVKSATTSGVT